MQCMKPIPRDSNENGVCVCVWGGGGGGGATVGVSRYFDIARSTPQV